MNKNNILPDLIFRKRNQRKNARKLEMNSADAIAESKFINIGGMDQWITIRGENKANPVLLFVHGGPASVYSVFHPLLRSWEEFFTVVQWDQRGAGKTYRKNRKNGNGIITLERLAQDGIEVTEYVCDRLNHEKIIVIGSSIGSLIGTIMVKQRPELFHAYVGTDQNGTDPNNRYYEVILDTLLAADHSKGIELVKKMGPDPSKWSRKDFDKMNQYIVKSMTGPPNMIMDLFLPAMLSSPHHSLRDIFDIFRGMSYSLDHLFEEFIAFDIGKLGYKFDIPYFIFQGDSDVLSPTELAQTYFEEVKAPYKEFVLIRNAGHLAAFARPDQFLEELRNRVAPLILRGE